MEAARDVAKPQVLVAPAHLAEVKQPLPGAVQFYSVPPPPLLPGVGRSAVSPGQGKEGLVLCSPLVGLLSALLLLPQTKGTVESSLTVAVPH